MLNNTDLENVEPKDEDKDGIPDSAEEKLDSVPEESKEYQESLTDGETDKGFFRKAVDKGRDTLAGETKAGKVIGFGLDVATFFAPHGSKIDKLRQKGKEALNLNKDKNDMKDALKGLVSKEAWKKILVFTDEDGNFSFQESLTTVVQLSAIIGALYTADYFGVLEPLMKIIGLS